MTALEVFRFHDSSNNTIKYFFNPSKRVDEGEGYYGPAILDQFIQTFDPELDTLPIISLPEPKPGTEVFRYMAKDGADVRFQYDPTARNGKSYVVAIHRDPENWQRVKLGGEEDLSVGNEDELRMVYEGSEEMEEVQRTPTKRRDSLLGDDPFLDERRVDDEMKL
ncbi:hypothetical protein K491DRAFT_697936 [Lophiostoma macrostomum CBS 122681]|uniref:Uncharacterized protein n=1 Tax=Lophiostoma macrostomum CBS 122681 TaxID=1314788 RepID=A0A6A6SQ59_9PLEO|nr:hypothetical protein K491DRAFT_697936 [Lophiostoma macrostomum CBS 122681]